MEGIYRGAALVEEVVRRHAPEDTSLLASVGAIVQEANDRCSVSVLVPSPLWQGSGGDPRSPTNTGGNGSMRNNSCAHGSGGTGGVGGGPGGLKDEATELRSELRERDLWLAASQESAARALREASDLHEELRERERRAAATSALEAAGIAELRSELDRRGQLVLQLQAELARVYSSSQVHGGTEPRQRHSARSSLTKSGASLGRNAFLDIPSEVLFPAPSLSAGADEIGDFASQSGARLDGECSALSLEGYGDFRMPQQCNAQEFSPPSRSAEEKGSYIHAAGGKVYWLNHEDPLDLQRLPDEAAGEVLAVNGVGLGARDRMHDAQMALQGDELAPGEPLLPGTPERRCRIDGRIDGVDTVPVPPPRRAHWTGLYDTQGSGGRGGSVASAKKVGGVMRSCSGPNAETSHLQRSAEQDACLVSANANGWSSHLGCAAVATFGSAALSASMGPAHLACASVPLTTVPSAPALEQPHAAQQGSTGGTLAPLTEVARRHLSEPRLSGSSVRVAVSGNGAGAWPVPAVPALGGCSAQAAPGIVSTPMSARGAMHAQHSWSPMPWSPAHSPAHPAAPPPMSARARPAVTPPAPQLLPPFVTASAGPALDLKGSRRR